MSSQWATYHALPLDVATAARLHHTRCIERSGERGGAWVDILTNARAGGRKDKVFLKEFLGRIRNFWEKCLILVIFCLFLDGFEGFFSNFRAFLRKFCLLGGIFVFSPPRSSGRISFQEIGPRKDKDFLLEYTPMELESLYVIMEGPLTVLAVTRRRKEVSRILQL